MKEPRDRVARYLSQTDEYYEQGSKSLKEDPHKACESVWGAVDRATRALALRYLGREQPPEKVSWLDFLQDAFTEAGLDQHQAREMALEHRGIRGELHGRCFYGGHYDRVEHDRLVKESGGYISTIKKLLEDL